MGIPHDFFPSRQESHNINFHPHGTRETWWKFQQNLQDPVVSIHPSVQLSMLELRNRCKSSASSSSQIRIATLSSLQAGCPSCRLADTVRALAYIHNSDWIHIPGQLYVFHLFILYVYIYGLPLYISVTFDTVVSNLSLSEGYSQNYG